MATDFKTNAENAAVGVLGNGVGADKSLGTLTLTYLEGRGAAETIRLLLSESGADWKDVRVTREQMQDLKSKLPYGQVPIIECSQYPGLILAQSNAIARFISKHYGLYGTNTVEAAQIDSISDYIIDITMDIRIHVAGSWVPEEKKAEGREKLKNELFPKHFKNLEAMVSGNASGWLVGNTISLADIAFFSFVNLLQLRLTDFPDILATSPGLKSLYQRVSERPRIAAWLKSRPVTPW